MKVEVSVFELDRVAPARITIELTAVEALSLFDTRLMQKTQHELYKRIWAIFYPDTK